jgi:starch synthase (maltosyl-transferring)
VEGVRPVVEGGQFAAKAAVGDAVPVEADAFVDGHDLLRVEVVYREVGQRSWRRELMAPTGNDRWRGSFVAGSTGTWQYFVEAAVDTYATWVHDLAARVGAGQDVSVELLVGVELVRSATAKAKGADRKRLAALADDLSAGYVPDVTELNDGILADLVARHSRPSTTKSPTYPVHVERVRARFSTWYELFPRSAGERRTTHGTFADVSKRLDYLSDLGIDILYLPPIHPIGTTARKGRNGATKAKRGDVGSPWAIGSAAGGHTAIHPDLGSMDDFAALVAAASTRGIEVALDIAFQCSPDHPWVTEHPEWFKHRPDGSIRYAENPPKRYEDIYPLDFDTAAQAELWEALRDVIEFWIAHGVNIFRVDNPHTKAFPFWEWLIPTIQSAHDGVIFLAEAFTRPKVMKRLAKLGFTQSYTYFAWRTHKWEIEEYLTDLTATDVVDYFRPNFWPNTPDILTEQLQQGNRHTFLTRALLAGTLAANYGIYGPVFELCVRAPRSQGSEEYLDSEKYEIRHFELDAARSIAPFLRRLNAIRHGHLAQQHDRTLSFHPVDNDQLIAYSKTAEGVGRLGIDSVDSDAVAPILVVASLDSGHAQSGWVDLNLERLGLSAEQPYVVHDLLSDASYEWKGHRNFVILNPAATPAHIFRIEPVGVGAR